MERQIEVVGNNSNDRSQAEAAEDSIEKLSDYASTLGYTFPYAVDREQEAEKDFNAPCPPDFFLFDRDSNLVYRGQLDGSRPGNDIPTDGSSLRSAIDALLNNKGPISEQLPSMGCNIKWKIGEEPESFLSIKN